ncbi:DNA-binding protein WhiA [Metamycoplasma hyosynoviae]|uniref:DNA-binding protein WhiA n=2 Tax=Metamycoplasma hyosynoviae TaxID=29559 RepID=UPI0023587A1B|nr:DNA-binding protein WhiA [Metamycoplasma hyosynoviae]MDC8915855.1 DNA-binding protein WhiA [Metamycoplasma hyosynoviae]MDC8921270.1 DNA-binding protein WhiA [Metamycoplasma hyosynoviae]MDC8937574.1 DNA-binding protein WhiA [Metamycoplasma hyosynoviae]MDC8963451.1 DNA-binding protein WhiA [Metamycoplasma hyosynoviae]MDD1378316.1 DNA-binding protein WhiA [Metamycoplasma hyosynoviae]
MDKSFTLALKEKIIARKYTKSSEQELLMGILYSSYQEDNFIYITINTLDVFTFVQKLLEHQKISFEFSKKNQFKIDANSINFENNVRRQNFFSGIFLNSGSIGDINTVHYHLELKFFNKLKAEEAKSILEKYNINFKVFERKNTFILYLKKIESICDFLRAIEMYDAYLEFEQTKIERDFTNNINRLTNFDFYNQVKLAKSNKIFLDSFDFIMQNSYQNLFNHKELEFFNFKKENIDLSLSELVEALANQKIYTSKSSLNRYLQKLKTLYNKLK